MNVLQRVWAAVKQFSLRWSAHARLPFGGLAGIPALYRQTPEVTRANSIVQACVLWMCRAFPEAPLEVRRLVGDDVQVVRGHRLTQLLARPNPYYSGLLLWHATLADWMLTGNAYWLKVRAGNGTVGRVVELWWVPSALMEPAWSPTGADYLTHYEYTVDGYRERVDLANVVHFRYGFDPDNVRKGLSPLAALLREVYTDDEAAVFTSSLLRNMGVPGVIITPGKDTQLAQGAADQIKSEFMQRFGGERRGQPGVFEHEMNVQVLSFSPEQMDMKTLRRLPEERVAAVFGIPAIVVGLGAGLERSTFANYAEAREAAYESNIIPTQRLLAAELHTQLLPDFERNIDAFDLGFDLSQVRVLQADQSALYEREARALVSGGIMVDEFRQAIGRDPLPSKQGQVFLVPGNLRPVLPADLAQPPPAPTPLRAVADGDDDEDAVRVAGRRALRSAVAAEAKTAASIQWRLESLRQQTAMVLDSVMAQFFREQAARVVGRLGDGKRYKATASDLLPDDETDRLREAWEPWYRTILTDTHGVIQTGLGVVFELDDPTVRRYLREAGTNIRGITQTTRDAVRAALQAGVAEGEGIPDLARRLRSLPEFDLPRARMVARTELGENQNRAAVASYRGSGVVQGVRVLDGDYDEECAAWNGREVPLAEAGSVPLLAHPNCTRALAPIVEAVDLAGKAAPPSAERAALDAITHALDAVTQRDLSAPILNVTVQPPGEGASRTVVEERDAAGHIVRVLKVPVTEGSPNGTHAEVV